MEYRFLITYYWKPEYGESIVETDITTSVDEWIEEMNDKTGFSIMYRILSIVPLSDDLWDVNV